LIPWSRLDPEGQYKGILHEGNDTSYQINRLDPAGQWLTLGYNLAALGEVKSEQEIAEAVLKATLSVGEKTLSSPFAGNIADFIEIFSSDYSSGNPEVFTKKLIKWGARNLANFVPMASRFRMNIEKFEDIDENGNLIARSGELPDIFTVEDPDDGSIRTFVDNGDGTYDMVEKATGLADDVLGNFNLELTNEVKKRMDRQSLPVAVDFWGREATEDPRVGPGGVLYSPVKFRDMPWQQQDLIDTGLFTEDDLKKTIPLLYRNSKFDEIANYRNEDGKAIFGTVLDKIGVSGEFERLSFGPNNHPSYLSIRGQRIPLNREQANDYKRLVNGDFSILTQDVLDEAPNYVSPEYYENVMMPGATLQQSLKTLMTSDAYYIYGSDDDMATTSREKMITNIINFHRHGKPEQFKNSFEESENLRIGLDGPDKLLLLKYPDLKYKALELTKNINDRNIKPLREVIGVD